MSDYLISGETMTNLADSVRTLSGETGEMTPDEMIAVVNNTKSAIDSLNEHIEDKNNPHNVTASQIGAFSIVELTKAEYDALEEKDPNILYVITDLDIPNNNNMSGIPITSEIPENADVWIDPTDEDGSFYTKNEVDALLANIDVGGGISMELLWENASPNSSFAAQTVALDLSEYQFAIIATSDGSFVVSKAVTTAHYLSTVSGNMFFRMVTVTENGLTFEDCKYAKTYGSSTFTAQNAIQIPIKIYGIKGVQSV